LAVPEIEYLSRGVLHPPAPGAHLVTDAPPLTAEPNGPEDDLSLKAEEDDPLSADFGISRSPNSTTTEISRPKKNSFPRPTTAILKMARKMSSPMANSRRSWNYNANSIARPTSWIGKSASILPTTKMTRTKCGNSV
jgi:hypothetical protein